MIAVGEMAPDFALESSQGPFLLSASRGMHNVVLIFYPKDNTSG